MSKAFIHESSYVDDDVTIGDDTKVWHFCHIQRGARIGSHCSFGQNVNIGNNVHIGNGVRIQNNVSVYEGVEIEDNVFCGPSCVFTNVTTPRAHFPVHGVYAKTVVKEGHYRKFSAINDMMTADYWQFKYVTQNLEGKDQTIYGGTVDTDKSHYPQPIGEVVGTIFFDSTPESLYLTSEIGDVIIDTEPPSFVSEDVQYMVFKSNRVCKFTIESDTLIDVCQLRILCGDDILYSCTSSETGTRYSC